MRKRTDAFLLGFERALRIDRLRLVDGVGDDVGACRRHVQAGGGESGWVRAARAELPAGPAMSGRSPWPKRIGMDLLPGHRIHDVDAVAAKQRLGVIERRSEPETECRASAPATIWPNGRSRSSRARTAGLGLEFVFVGCHSGIRLRGRCYAEMPVVSNSVRVNCDGRSAAVAAPGGDFDFDLHRGSASPAPNIVAAGRTSPR